MEIKYRILKLWLIENSVCHLCTFSLAICRLYHVGRDKGRLNWTWSYIWEKGNSKTGIVRYKELVRNELCEESVSLPLSIQVIAETKPQAGTVLWYGKSPVRKDKNQ